MESSSILGSEGEVLNASILTIHGPYFHDVSIAKRMRCGERAEENSSNGIFFSFEYIVDVLLFGIGK